LSSRGANGSRTLRRQDQRGGVVPPELEGVLALLPQLLNATTSKTAELMRSMVTCGPKSRT
jgi:hypothetical protein